MSEFEFDGFIEADSQQATTTVKTVTDNFKHTPAFKIGIIGVGQCGNKAFARK
jgi:cell division GTPase FtsZ